MDENLRHTWELLKLRFLNDKRTKQTFGSTLLYMINTVLICYFSFQASAISTWNVLFWIILFFSAINIAAKSKQPQDYTYSYVLAGPGPLILSELIYNILYIEITAIIQGAIFMLLLGWCKDHYLYLAFILNIGTVAISSILTMLANIAERVQTNITMVTILGCPIILPCLINLIQLTNKITHGKEAALITFSEFIPSTALAGIALTCTIILFACIWRE